MAFLNLKSTSFNRNIRTGLGISLIILFLSSFFAYYSLQRLIDQANSVDHTNKIILILENILSTIKDAETGVRGYLLAKDSSILKPYLNARYLVDKKYDEVRFLTRDNDFQQRNLDTLKELIDRRFEKLQFLLDYYHARRETNVEDVKQSNRSMDYCRAVIGRMQEEERRLLADRTAAVKKYSYFTPLVIFISSVLAIVVSSISFYSITRDIKNRQMIEEELKTLNKQLSSFNQELEYSKAELDKRNYILTGTDELNNLLRGEKDLDMLADGTIKHLCEYMKAQAGVIYIVGEDGNFYLKGGYGFAGASDIASVVLPGEGLIGQAVLNRKTLVLDKIPSGSLRINTGLTSIVPAQLLILPINIYEDTYAVAELLSKENFEEKALNFAENIRDKLAIIIRTIQAEVKMMELLNETQNQAEELETQQEELRQINDELVEQRNKLQASEEELRVSQEELQEKNAELEEKAGELEHQYELIRIKNVELENARVAVQLKMEQAETMSKYKSEFLANMSHELRTPLNSILILAKLISENSEGRLSPKEVEFANIIHDSGNDLLKLINEILDLAKIESGKINLEIKSIPLRAITIANQFVPVAKEKHIHFDVIFDPDLPPAIDIDKFRLEQIIKNLLSNAFKFTPEAGQITFHVYPVKEKIIFLNEPLQKAEQVIAFSVKDTGIGIPKEKQNLIFEAFQQADSSTTRKYGGTGLGLSISRELVNLLGGEIHLESEENQGSNFIVYLPVKYRKSEKSNLVLESVSRPIETVSETESKFPSMQKESLSGEALKELTGIDGNKILIIEDNPAENKALRELFLRDKIQADSVFTGKEGLEKLKSGMFEVVVLDIMLPDMKGYQLIEQIRKEHSLKKIPVVIHSGRDMSEEEHNQLKKYANAVIIKTDYSYKRLLDEVHHLLEKTYSEEADQEETLKLHRPEETLKGKKVLLVDDDMRNVYSLHNVLDNEGMNIVVANDGKQALNLLEENPDTDIILMDIMMPEMDGLECTKRIKRQSKFEQIPVLALTAKAMREDREKALQAGASDYITKPVDINKLLSLMRVWVYEKLNRT